MKKCLLIHSSFNHLGGAEMLSFRLINSLIKSGYKVYVLQIGKKIDLNEISRWSGIDVNEKHIEQINSCTINLIDKIMAGRKLSLLRYALALRLSRLYNKRYDLVVSSFGEMPLEIHNGFQFIHAPLFSASSDNLKYLGFSSDNILKEIGRKFYVFLSRFIAGWSASKVEKFFSIANSKWSAEEIKKCYPNIEVDYSYIGASTKKVFTESNIDSLWLNRKNSVAILGRVAKGKNIELAIEFIEKMRIDIPDLHLSIFGSPESEEYRLEIENLIKGKPFIKWYIGLSRDELEDKISTHKWGLHCSIYEHYGLSAIELQRLGCITFVPNSCGQKEVTNNHLLKYSSLNELLYNFKEIFHSPQLINEANISRLEVIKNHTIDRHDEQMSKIFYERY